MKRHPLFLVVGGASSGKSEFAERLAARYGDRVLYLATAVQARRSDGEWRRKIEAHRARRPKRWETLVLDGQKSLGMILARDPEVILLDSLTLWVSRHLRRSLSELQSGAQTMVDRLRLKAPLIVVSDEVGMSLTPVTSSGRRFSTALGRINHLLARSATAAYFVVFGQALQIKRRASASI